VLAAATEVFARDGFEGASLRNIADVAGVDIATLKYHVGDKASLFTEVYQDGYEHFQQSLGPLILRVPLARNPEELVTEVRALLERGYDYLEENQAFVRLWLFRLLEGPQAVLQAEETLRSNVMNLIEAAVGILRERGLVRGEVDVRVLVLALITALPTLALGAKARPGLLGPSERAPRERFIDFFVEVLRRQMLP
jgi:AcrR family transcriptional regulator